MIIKLRKHNKWFMVGFAVLLMLAWLQGPSTRAVSNLTDRTVARLDGRKIKGSDMGNAQRELHALGDWAPGLVHNVLGFNDRGDSVHWLLLSREAEDAGYVGDAGDGEKFLEDVSRQMAAEQLRYAFDIPPDKRQGAFDQLAAMSQLKAQQAFGQARMNQDEMHRTLARADGILRMIRAFTEAARVSDRRAIAEARKSDDSAVVDTAFLPAEALARTIPDPGPEALQAHFDRFKTVKPGEGEYGIGYLLPSRVKIEYLALDRKAIEDAVRLDPVEVIKRYRQAHPGQTGAIPPEERTTLEARMRSEEASRLMQEAQVIIQSEITKVTRRLDRDGKYRKLPADWDQTRPQLSAIAVAVQDQLSKSAGISFPLPAVTVKGEWLTQQKLAQLPGIGRGTLKQGGLDMPFTTVVFWTRELGGQEGPIAIQKGIPLAENYLSDAAGDRYYFTVLDTHAESAPDSVAEIHDDAVHDYKVLQAFEALRARADEFRAALITGGVAGAAEAFVKTPLPEGKLPDKPQVDQAVRVGREGAGSRDLNRDKDVMKAIVDAASKLDPKAPPDSFSPEQSTMVLPSAKAKGLYAVRLRAFAPLTREDYARIDRMAVGRANNEEMQGAIGTEPPFSLDALLRRHIYLRGDERIRSAKELSKDKDESAG